MVLDSCWFVVLPDNRGIVYTTPSQNAHEAWEKATEIISTHGIKGHTPERFMGTGMDRKRMEELGYRARKVQIVFK